MKIVVQKYGGSSVATTDKIKKVAEKVIRKKEEGYKLVVILSAMGKTTDTLISLANDITDNPDPREMDMLLSTGEQVSIALLSMALNAKGYSAVSFTGSQLNIQTTSIHQRARIKDIEVTKLEKALKDDKIVVVAGFQGVTKDNEYTTLGRGGSDTSAVALAAKLKARCEIYTDVEGIYTMDPRKLKGARKIDKICYEEMMEIASLGAGVIHYRAVEMGHKYKIPIYIGSTFSDKSGTIITNGGDHSMEKTLITGMASNTEDIQVTMLNLASSTESLHRLFGELATEEANVDMISQMLTEDNKMNVSFTIPKTDLHIAKEIVDKWRKEDKAVQWEVTTDIAKISVVGLGMRSHSGVAAKIFQLMAENNIEIKMITTSEIKITWVVDISDEKKTLELIGKEFGLEERVEL